MAEVEQISARFQLEVTEFTRQTAGMLRRLDRVQRELQQTGTAGAKGFGQMEAAAVGASKSIGTAGAAMGQWIGLIKAYLALRAVREVAATSVSFENLNAQLRFLVGSQENANAAFARLTQISKTLGANTLELAKSYVPLAGAIRGSSISLADMEKIFAAFALTARVTGSSNQQLSGAFTQIQQAIAKNKFEMQDLKIIMESIPGAAALLNKVLRKMGTNLGDLSKSGVDVRAVLLRFADAANRELAPSIDDLAKRSTSGFNAMVNAWDRVVKAFVDSGALSTIAKGFEGIAHVIDYLAGNSLSQLKQSFEDNTRLLTEMQARLNELTTTGPPKAADLNWIQRIFGVETYAQQWQDEIDSLKKRIATQTAVVEEGRKRLQSLQSPAPPSVKRDTSIPFPADKIKEWQSLYTEALSDAEFSAKKNAEAIKAFTDQLKTAQEEAQDLADIFNDDFRDPLQQFRLDRAQLARAQETGRLDPGVFEKSLANLETTLAQGTTLGAAFEATMTSIGDTVANAAVGVAQGTQTMSEAIKNMVNSIAASLLSSGINALIAQFTASILRLAGSSFAGTAPGATPLGGGGSQFPAITPFASGGMVTQPTLALLGERSSSNPEYVLNRHQLAAMRQQSAPQLTVINVANQEEAQRIAALERAMGRTVTISSLAQDILSKGNGSPVVKAMRYMQGA